VSSLKARGISADSLNSLMSAQEQKAVRARLADRSLRLLYVSPERADRLAADLAAMSIRPSLVAVDEAPAQPLTLHQPQNGPNGNLPYAYRTHWKVPPVLHLAVMVLQTKQSS